MQKFQKGDFVFIDKKMPNFMKYFHSGCIAIVQGSYSDLCEGHGRDDNKYSVRFISNGHTNGLIRKEGRTSSWYYEEQLTLIGKTGIELSDWFRDYEPTPEIKVPFEKSLAWKLFKDGYNLFEEKPFGELKDEA